MPACEMLGNAGDLAYLPSSGKYWTSDGPTPTVSLFRMFGDPPHTGVRVIVGLDGSVVAASTGVVDEAKTYSSTFEWLSGDRWATNLAPPGPCGGLTSGIVANVVGEQYPKVTFRLPCAGDTAANWAVSPKHVFRALSGIERYGWDKAGPIDVYKPQNDPDGLPVYFNNTLGDTLLLTVNAGGKAGVMSWTETDGLRPLLRWYGSYEHFAVRFGTDGKDMVWIEGVGPQKSLYVAQTMTLMTAPFSLDAKTVEATKKPLGPDPIQQGGGPFPTAVGCGHAAMLMSTKEGPGFYNGLLVVRLTDGAQWVLKASVVPYPMNGVGVTCEHVYFRVPGGRLGRFPLASLTANGGAQ